VTWNGQPAAGIQRGTFPFSTIVAGGTAVIAVTFPTPFASTPVVIPGASSSGGLARFQSAWVNVTTTGFSLVVTNSSASDADGFASWTAIP
jgi:hypothetical protein